jgi:hypothetical protein
VCSSDLCLTKAENAQRNLSSAAFADDLAIVTNSATLLQHQADKVTLYCNWAGLEVNAKKCAVSAALFQLWHAEGTTNYTHNHHDQRPHRQVASLAIQGKPIPFLPHMESYTYLGIPLNLALNWTPALQTLIQKIQQKGRALLSNQQLTAAERHRILMETIIPMADYKLTLAIFTPAQIDLIQGHMARIIKLSHGLPPYFPTYATFNTHKEGGIGSGSLFHRCIKNVNRDITHILNDQGRVGTVSRALGAAQHKNWQAHPKLGTTTLGPIGNSSTILRQLNLLQQAGITHLQQEQPIPWAPKAQPLHTTLTKFLDTAQLPHQLLVALHNLWELGITNIAQLLCQSKPYAIISSQDLYNLLNNQVKYKHRTSHNTLTWFIHTATTTPPTTHWKGSKALTLSHRTCHPNLYPHLEQTKPRAP